MQYQEDELQPLTLGFDAKGFELPFLLPPHDFDEDRIFHYLDL